MREKTPNFWILGNVCSDNKSDLLISSELPKKQEVTYFGQKKKKSSETQGFQGFGGDCWTRTSDLLRVKQAL